MKMNRYQSENYSICDCSEYIDLDNIHSEHVHIAGVGFVCEACAEIHASGFWCDVCGDYKSFAAETPNKRDNTLCCNACLVRYLEPMKVGE